MHHVNIDFSNTVFIQDYDIFLNKVKKIMF